MKIQLIIPPLPESQKTIESGWWQPLCLTSLAAYLHSNNKSLDIEIIDGEITDFDEIEKRIGADIVGIKPSILNYSKSLEIARIAKSRGANVIMGGHHATAMADKILKKRKYIDAIVIYDGEYALNEIVSGTRYSEIHNLVYRDKGKIITNEPTFLDLDRLPWPAMDYLELDKYFENFKKSNFTNLYQRPMTIYSQKGCLHRSREACTFCGRMYKDWHVRAADTVVQQIKYLSKKYDVDCVIDAADDFPANNEWAEKFFKHKARVIPDVIMRIYSRSSNINENVAKLMYHAGVRQVLLGIESGSEKMLKNCKKGLICNDHIKALNIFGDKGIKVDMSFVIGIEGETIETLSETINFVKNFRNFDLGTTFFNLFTPLPGSPSFTKIINNKKVKNKYSNDILPIKDLQNDWLSLFTDINRKDYMDAVSEVKNILKNVYSDYEINESKKS